LAGHGHPSLIAVKAGMSFAHGDEAIPFKNAPLTGVLYAERHEHRCADMARLAGQLQRSFGGVLCARSVRGGQVQIGRSGADDLTCTYLPSWSVRRYESPGMTEDPDEPIGYGAIVVGASGR
jgi:hypothetical protein